MWADVCLRLACAIEPDGTQRARAASCRDSFHRRRWYVGLRGGSKACSSESLATLQHAASCWSTVSWERRAWARTGKWWNRALWRSFVCRTQSQTSTWRTLPSRQNLATSKSSSMRIHHVCMCVALSDPLLPSSHEFLFQLDHLRKSYARVSQHIANMQVDLLLAPQAQELLTVNVTFLSPERCGSAVRADNAQASSVQTSVYAEGAFRRGVLCSVNLLTSCCVADVCLCTGDLVQLHRSAGMVGNCCSSLALSTSHARVGSCCWLTSSSRIWSCSARRRNAPRSRWQCPGRQPWFSRSGSLTISIIPCPQRR